MALFKILRGQSATFTTDLRSVNVHPGFVDGYCYFLPDTGLFYIDYDDGTVESFEPFEGDDVGYSLEEGLAYYLKSGEDYVLYSGNYNLLVQYGSPENIPTLYRKINGWHRIPLNANEARAVQAVTEINNGLEQKFWRGTKAEYDAIEEKDDNVLYIITDEFEVAEKTFMDKSLYDTENRQEDVYKYADNTHKSPKSGFILTDTVNGFNYAIQMVNGNLVSKLCIKSLKVVQMPNKTSYIQYEQFDPTGMIVTVEYEDGTIVENCNFYQYNRGVDKADFSIYYDQVSIIEDIIQLEVEPFNPEEILIDFYYIDNGDGTYTITEWKHTLNGVYSENDMIVPNFTNINIQ